MSTENQSKQNPIGMGKSHIGDYLSHILAQETEKARKIPIIACLKIPEGMGGKKLLDVGNPLTKDVEVQLVISLTSCTELLFVDEIQHILKSES